MTDWPQGPQRLQPTTTNDMQDVAPPTILVIEDNPVSQKMVRSALEGAGYRVLTAGSGRESIAHVHAGRPDLILMDLVLPDTTGSQLLGDIRGMRNGERVPVLACTGFVSRADEARYAGSDFSGFVLKPIDINQLLQAVQKNLVRGDSKHKAAATRRILLVDDDSLQQRALRIMLERAGHKVVCAESAETAMQRGRSDPPEVMITDILMPRTDGFTLCTDFRHDPQLHRIPVILISGNYLSEEDEQLAMRCGASAFLTREDPFERLLAAIEHVIAHPAPVPAASAADVEDEHVSRMAHQLERQSNLYRDALKRSTVQAALLQQVSSISEALSRHRDASVNLAEILSPCLDSAGLSRGLLYLTEDGDGNRLRLEAQVGCNHIIEAAQSLFAVPQLFARLAHTREPLALTHTGDDPEEQRLLRQSESVAALLFPVVSREHYFGAFLLLSAQSDISREDWLAFGRALASQIGVTLTLSHTFSELAHSEQRNRSIFERAHDAIFITDDDLRIVDANPASVSLTGYSLDQLRQMHLSDLADEYLRAKLPMLHATYRRHGTLSDVLTFIRADGGERIVRVAGSRISPMLYANLCQDITQQKRQEEAIRRLAYTDPLTDLPNRTALHNRINEAIQQSREQRREFAVVIIDLANFRQINSTLGHHNGDLVLNLVAQRLQAAAGNAYVARIGGDEFAVILRAPRATDGFEEEMRSLLDSLESDLIIEQVPVAVEAVAGMAIFPRHGDEDGTLLRHAHIAVRSAHATRRPWMIYEPGLDQFRPENLAVLAEIRQALLNRRELVLHYQPQLNLATGRVTGVEALVRWQHPSRGMLPPAAFLPVIEHTRMINDLAKWVLAETVEQARLWEQAGLPLSIAFNLTAEDLEGDLVERIEQALTTSGIPAQRLTIELTEGSLMTTAGNTLSTLQSIRDMGVRLALDDFGAGYSALSYLGRLPLDTIKLDRSFAMAFPDRSAQAIVRGAILLAHDLGLSVTAEGVETRDALDVLQEWGCDEAQGYYLTRALPPDQLAGWLTQSQWYRTHSEAF
jgi:diguanylate cyclase (GGDEF)-like protein/PAS domain S-box-containing protein